MVATESNDHDHDCESVRTRATRNPLTRFLEDWSAAQQSRDPSANLAAVATVDANGEPDVRTLILRLLDDQLAILFNQTSPKWEQFGASQTTTLLLYWPSIQCQYRLRCTHRYMPTHRVHESWSLRQTTPKRLDWLYTMRQPQSSPISNVEVLARSLAKLPITAPMVAPATAIGFYLSPQRIERLELNDQDQPHDRQLYELDENGWSFTHLVP